MVKSSPSEQATKTSANHPFLQPALPRRASLIKANAYAKVFHKDLNMIMELDDFNTEETIRVGGESPLLDEHEVIE